MLAELERKIEREEAVTKLSAEVSHLDSLVREMESKCQQLPNDLLRVRHIKHLLPLHREWGKT